MDPIFCLLPPDTLSLTYTFPDPNGEILGDGRYPVEPRADIEGGTGDEALDVGSEDAGDMVGVGVVTVRSGWDTELTQQRLDSFDSFRMGRLDWNLGWSVKVGWLRVGREAEVEL